MRVNINIEQEERKNLGGEGTWVQMHAEGDAEWVS